MQNTKKVIRSNEYDQIREAQENKIKITKGVLNDERYNQILNSKRKLNDKEFLHWLDKVRIEDRKLTERGNQISSKQHNISSNNDQHISLKKESLIQKNKLSEVERLRELDRIKKELKERSVKAQHLIDSNRLGELNSHNIISNNMIDRQEEKYQKQKKQEKYQELQSFLSEQMQEQKQRERDELTYNKKMAEIQQKEITHHKKQEKKKLDVRVTHYKVNKRSQQEIC